MARFLVWALFFNLTGCTSIELPDYVNVESFEALSAKREQQVEEDGADDETWARYMNRYISYPEDCSQLRGPSGVELLFSHNKKGIIDKIAAKGSDPKSLCYAANFYKRRYVMMPFSPYYQKISISEPNVKKLKKQAK